MGMRDWLLPSPALDTLDTHAELSRIVIALLRSASTLLDVDDEHEMLQRYCDALTERVPSLALAWIWFGRPDTDLVSPQVAAGPARRYVEALAIPRTRLTERGPVYRALAGSQDGPFDVSRLSLFGPWREAAREHGIRSVLALQLRSSVDAQRGVFVLYATVDGYFDRVGVDLFEALAELFSAVLSRTARHAALAQAVTRDALTGLMNRHGLASIAQRLQRAAPEDAPAALLLLDLDHFKRVNDNHGHAAGDQVLHSAGQLLLGAVRMGDLVARWGGEEFLVGLPGADETAALAVAEKLRAGLAALPHRLAGGAVLQVTASIGVICLQFGESLDQGLIRVDAALYAAKHAGRDRVLLG